MKLRAVKYIACNENHGLQNATKYVEFFCLGMSFLHDMIRIIFSFGKM
jgi:hypothetical protein